MQVAEPKFILNILWTKITIIKFHTSISWKIICRNVYEIWRVLELVVVSNHRVAKVSNIRGPEVQKVPQTFLILSGM